MAVSHGRFWRTRGGGGADDGSRSDGLGNGKRVIVLQIPADTFDDIGDGPPPDIIPSLTGWALAQASSMTAIAQLTHEVATDLSERR